MNIKKIDDIYQVNLPASNKANKGHGFKEIMDKKISEIDVTTRLSGNRVKAEVVENGEKILSLLDTYADALTDPSKTLKDIEPLVQSIEEKVGHIEKEAADQIPVNDELNGIIKDLAVTANVALFKFHRGDYM